MVEKSVVLITGVAGGIGRATAECFSQAGWLTIGVDRRPGENLKGVDHYIQADAAVPREIAFAVEEAGRRAGRLNALINLAAVQICRSIIEVTGAEWDEVMAVNARAPFLFTRAAYPLLKASGGAIVNVASVHAVATSRNISAYAASKGALVAFTRAAAIEFGGEGIRVNAIMPGAVDTPMLRAGLLRGHLAGAGIEELLDALARKTVIGRVGTPAEIAEAILFMADNARSSFMTGQTLVVDGGATSRLSTE